MKGRGNSEKLSESGQRSSRRQFRVQCSLPVQNPQIRRGRSSSGKFCPRPHLVFLGTAVTLLLNIRPLLWSFGGTGRENNFARPHRSTEYREERDGEGGRARHCPDVLRPPHPRVVRGSPAPLLLVTPEKHEILCTDGSYTLPHPCSTFDISDTFDVDDCRRQNEKKKKTWRGQGFLGSCNSEECGELPWGLQPTSIAPA